MNIKLNRNCTPKQWVARLYSKAVRASRRDWLEVIIRKLCNYQHRRRMRQIKKLAKELGGDPNRRKRFLKSECPYTPEKMWARKLKNQQDGGCNQ